ncbi:hypothetical protein CLAFUW4_02786 [Fulvia fulva]|uniref:Uncharacterized protein n=1 Tax=Passalora fulva TaxID=5499 RepID=A0A9Q8LBR3_PASFU|nr:uncharacterized protein CLAFUR5_02773 [Fulvia fulva]KAK4632226.1 hypothetical protein CLAFUR4_02780 [Fulvia fulva]KAK4633184.1 hypothetical protein CLAFUR0_02782 [Fulvia fulva]UJO13838.1 hypothetical protein CLAFUR5_02773 [Fulvia fulva]WPV10612.1 hypothetical protein CLAFUW4_02786 [Fulvia fulva]WPV25674.1 hypothetical protein CLAFUW7_02784 [Fulvia fulva]
MAHPRHFAHQTHSTYFDVQSSLFGPHVFSITAIEPDPDANVDDWHAFAVNSAYYGSPTSLLYAIASTFVSRAKRAYASGKTWEEFEREEWRVDSAAVAKAEVDPAKRKVLMQESLDNGVRLGVLRELKGRLRTEVWAERELERKDSKVDGRADTPVENGNGVDEERTVERFSLGPGRRLVVEWREDVHKKG